MTIAFQMFANNQAGVILNNGRDYSNGPNQNAEVDLLLGGADPFTNAAADIVSTLYGPGSDNLSTNPNPWGTYASTLSLAARHLHAALRGDRQPAVLPARRRQRLRDDLGPSPSRPRSC